MSHKRSGPAPQTLNFLQLNISHCALGFNASLSKLDIFTYPKQIFTFSDQIPVKNSLICFNSEISPQPSDPFSWLMKLIPRLNQSRVHWCINWIGRLSNKTKSSRWIKSKTCFSFSILIANTNELIINIKNTSMLFSTVWNDAYAVILWSYNYNGKIPLKNKRKN